MKVFVLLFAAFLGVSHGAATNIAQTVNGPDGLTRNGVATITVSDVCTTSGGTLISKASVRVPFLAGVFATQLVPNDVCLSWGGFPTTYTVNWQVCLAVAGASLSKPCSGPSQAYAETWFVPTSSSTLPIYGTGGVKVDAAVPSLNVAGLSDGLYTATIHNHSLTALIVGGARSPISFHGRIWSSLEGTSWADVLALGATW